MQTARVPRTVSIPRLVGILLVGAGLIGLAAAFLWIGPRVQRSLQQIAAAVVKTHAVFLELRGEIATMDPVLERLEGALAHGRDLAAETAEFLNATETTHRALAHAMTVASQDLARLPAAGLFRGAAERLVDSADRAARLGSGVAVQHQRAEEILREVPTVRHAFLRVHTAADTLANRLEKANLLLAHTHPYRVFLAVAAAVSLLSILVGVGLFCVASRDSRPAV